MYQKGLYYKQNMDQVLNRTRIFLQLLISSYLRRSGPQDIYLLKNHIQDTAGLATSINSHLDQGLTIFNATSNKNVYGSNMKKVSEDHKLYQLYKIVKSQLFKIKCALLLITIFMQFISGFVWNNTQMKRTSIFIEVLICLSLISKIYLRWRSFSIMCKENYGKKTNTVHAYRNGEKIQINDAQITVGDVLFIDFNQTIPASGILISPFEIAVDEDYIGKGIQKKLNFQQCIKHIENKNQLQLKIEYENGTLPSPVLIRGSRTVQGGAFKMLVISTEESKLIEKYDKSCCSGQKLVEKSMIEQWINSISLDLQHISQVCFIIVLVFHTIAMVFKILGLPPNNYLYLMQNIIDQLYTIIAASFLLDANILVDLFKGEYINVLSLVQRAQELDKLLSVEQIIITDENICKYDQIKPKKIVLCDIYEPVDIKLLPAMQETIHYNILYEILGGVQLDSDLPHKILNKCHKNTIIHVNNSQQKIFSSLYEQSYSIEASFLAQDQGTAVGLCKGNKVAATKPNVSILSPALSHQCPHIQQNKKVQRHHHLQTQSISKKVGTDDKLQEYLNKECPFSTQNIIEGINKLAGHQSRTYYFQKFSIQRLSKSKYIWNHGKFTPIKTEDRDRLLVGVKKLEKQNLTVYLIGIDWGAFSNQYMGYLFGAIGVQISQQYKIIEKLKQLEKIGVSSLITIFKNNFEEMNELQRHQYQYDFLKRGWMNQNQHFSKLQEIKRAGGRKICRICLLSKCQCRPKCEELSNVQGFLMAIQDVKCIYNITQEDIEYIELGFEQLNVSALRIIDRKEETISRLNQLIIGHQLINKLQENLSFWILNILIVFFCCLPINYMTFGCIFCHEQLYFYFIYIQFLFAKNHFVHYSQQDVQEQKGKSRRNKNLLGWNIKGDILIFLVLLIAACITIIYFPKLFVKQNLSQYLAQYTCTVTKSFYHNPNIKTHVCQNGVKTVTLYPKLPTFIFLITMFAMTFKSFISTQRILTLINIGWHIALVGALMIFAYVCPALLHLCHHGLNAFEFGFALLIAFSIAVLSKLNGWIIGSLQGGKRFELSLDLWAGKQYNQYSQILKQYKQEKTLKYPYEQQ